MLVVCPTAEVTEQQRGFAAGVLVQLLHEVEVRNANADPDIRKGRYTFQISHAWTEGAMMYLVYRAPPSDRTWGLARDTRQSLINPGPWNDTDDPARYYYLLDLEENWPGLHPRRPGEPDTIWWHGHPLNDVITHPGDISEQYRYSAPPTDPSWVERRKPVVNEARRYADPL